MFIIYDLITLLFTLVFFPVYLFKGKFHRGFLARLGLLPKNLDLNRPIWVHAVSLGEAISIRTLIECLRKANPAKKFVISTVTPTGNKIARSLAKEGDLVTYLPLDFSFIVKGVLNRIDPEIFIIAETELWPNLIRRLYQNNIPVIIVNGRISDASFKGYSLARPLIKPVLNKISLFCVQAGTDAARLKSLGAWADKIKVTGNMKFDQLASSKSDGYKEKLGLGANDRLFIAGSTHPGEEEVILSAYKSLLKEFGALRLLIAPRHPQRAQDIDKIILKSGFSAKRVSELTSFPASGSYPHTVFILDTIGELINFYAAADIVFIGGSLIKRGGHNILEPAACNKPVIFGPYMFNFRDITGLFLKNNAAIMVKSEAELSAAIGELLGNNSRAAQLINNAKAVIAANRGATKRNIEAIQDVYGNIKRG